MVGPIDFVSAAHISLPLIMLAPQPTCSHAPTRVLGSVRLCVVTAARTIGVLRSDLGCEYSLRCSVLPECDCGRQLGGLILGLQLRGSDRFRGFGVRGSVSERCGDLVDASRKGEGAREKRLFGLPQLANGRVPWLDRLISVRLLTSR